MDAVAYSNFRQKLKSYMRQVNDNSDALIVTSKEPDEEIVVMSKRDYDAMQETMRILSNDYLMEKIRLGDRELEQGQFKAHDLIEDATND
ncbi:type II toxin-antitoxin system Phd/YefM family antitoxin [Levilactobacillus bambusae]|uniref:Antitoxin n=1 Tax=Levilactobacillus bambusae TaxID=2024736 RepID=A0A2V1MZL1_9LACO|nr:type II toxin-antitoxin system Phd/YefM family antitoxin [Levilactobacillus bambusae]PWG00451.1 type II toxin-antitoxin system prevent-host-death family antitoxin [Levilactobacillus bambusae]